MMKKHYVELEYEIEKFTVLNVITTSGDGDGGIGDKDFEIEF